VWGLSRAPVPYFPNNTVWSSPEDISEFLTAHPVDVVINAVAVASHEKCEQDPAHATHVNAVLPGGWASQCARLGVGFVHVSTDAVFDGTSGQPYREVDEPRPLSVYGETKLHGERSVATAHPGALIARTNFFGWSATGDKGVLDFFVTAMTEKRSITGFSDYRVSSMYMGHLARALMEAVQAGARGVHHMVAAAGITKFDFGLAVAKEFQLDASGMTPGLVGSGSGLAKRGTNLELSVERIEALLQRPMESVEEGLAEAKKERSALMDYFVDSEGLEAKDEN
jgi:dTDP-4-dehydrorhamnose reductase